METQCMFCHKNMVPVSRWNLPCDECKQLRKTENEQPTASLPIHNRKPAAVVRPDGTEKTDIFVDKFGTPVPNPGYDLGRDPHGWEYTGKLKQRGTQIR